MPGTSMKVKVHPADGIVMELAKPAALNLLRLGQAEPADDASRTAAKAMGLKFGKGGKVKKDKAKRKRKDRRGAPENKARK